MDVTYEVENRTMDHHGRSACATLKGAVSVVGHEGGTLELAAVSFMEGLLPEGTALG